MDELGAWWLKLLLRPGVAAVHVAHAQVPLGRLLVCDGQSAGQLEARAGAGRLRQLAGAGLRGLEQLLRALGRQPPGRYLLAHAPEDATCCLFRALPPELAEGFTVGGALPVLPWHICSCTIATWAGLGWVGKGRQALPCLSDDVPPPAAWRAGGGGAPALQRVVGAAERRLRSALG